MEIMICGTAAAGASVNVESSAMGMPGNTGIHNNTAQPVALATNGNLAIVPGVTYGSNTNGESWSLLNAVVEVY